MTHDEDYLAQLGLRRAAPAAPDDEAVRWMHRATIYEAAMLRLGHSSSRQDHHAQICGLCAALREGQAV